MEELRLQQDISLDMFNQEWGQLSGSTSFGHYFHDFKKNNLRFSVYTDLRLYKGLSLNFNGYYAFQRDQLNIVKGDIKNEDLLTRRRQLDSNYSYYTSFGLRYRFGDCLIMRLIHDLMVRGWEWFRELIPTHAINKVDIQ